MEEHDIFEKISADLRHVTDRLRPDLVFPALSDVVLQHIVLEMDKPEPPEATVFLACVLLGADSEEGVRTDIKEVSTAASLVRVMAMQEKMARDGYITILHPKNLHGDAIVTLTQKGRQQVAEFKETDPGERTP